MISSVVAHFDCESSDCDQRIAETIESLQQLGDLELGPTINGQLPIVIDRADPLALESATEQIRNLRWVSHVDVAFVYFGSDSPLNSQTCNP